MVSDPMTMAEYVLVHKNIRSALTKQFDPSKLDHRNFLTHVSYPEGHSCMDVVNQALQLLGTLNDSVFIAKAGPRRIRPGIPTPEEESSPLEILFFLMAWELSYALMYLAQAGMVRYNRIKNFGKIRLEPLGFGERGLVSLVPSAIAAEEVRRYAELFNMVSFFNRFPPDEKSLGQIALLDGESLFTQPGEVPDLFSRLLMAGDLNQGDSPVQDTRPRIAVTRTSNAHAIKATKTKSKKVSESRENDAGKKSSLSKPATVPLDPDHTHFASAVTAMGRLDNSGTLIEDDWMFGSAERLKTDRLKEMTSF